VQGLANKMLYRDCPLSHPRPLRFSISGAVPLRTPEKAPSRFALSCIWTDAILGPIGPDQKKNFDGQELVFAWPRPTSQDPQRTIFRPARAGRSFYAIVSTADGGACWHEYCAFTSTSHLPEVIMRAIQKILFPTDFSKESRPAMELAIEMARKFGARLTLLHVWTDPRYIGAVGNAYELAPELLRRAQEEAEHALDKLRLEVVKAGVPVEALTLEGFAEDVILTMAHTQQMDLIVMGTHGRTGLKRFFLGSIAERVLRTADCPVLTVRPPAQTT